jgi:hypothetical protein
VARRQEWTIGSLNARHASDRRAFKLGLRVAIRAIEKRDRETFRRAMAIAARRLRSMRRTFVARTGTAPLKPFPEQSEPVGLDG